MPNKVDEILVEVLNTGIRGLFKPNEYGWEKIKEAKLALLKVLVEELPEKKEAINDNYNTTYEQCSYYNHALSEVKDKLTNLLTKGGE